MVKHKSTLSTKSNIKDMKRNVRIHMIAILFYGLGAGWGIIEGFDYLVYQDKVNWLFLVPLIGGMSVVIINMIIFIFKK